MPSSDRPPPGPSPASDSSDDELLLPGKPDDDDGWNESMASALDSFLSEAEPIAARPARNSVREEAGGNASTKVPVSPPPLGSAPPAGIAAGNPVESTSAAGRRLPEPPAAEVPSTESWDRAKWAGDLVDEGPAAAFGPETPSRTGSGMRHETAMPSWQPEDPITEGSNVEGAGGEQFLPPPRNRLAPLGHAARRTGQVAQSAASAVITGLSRARAGASVAARGLQGTIARRRSGRAAHRPAASPLERLAVIALVLVGVAEAAVIGWHLLAGSAVGPSGMVTVTSRPAGAQILLDGEVQGITPSTFRVAEGVRALEIRSSGPTQIMALNITKGDEVSRFFDLPAGTAAASLRVESKPAGARVLVDGRVRGQTPTLVSGLNPGPHTVRIERGVQWIQRGVTLGSGARSSLSIPLDSPVARPTAGHGWLTVSSPVEVQAYENGRLVGTSLAGPWQLPAGRHDLDFLNEMFGIRIRKSVEVADGRTHALVLEPPKALLSITTTPRAEIQIDGESVGMSPVVGRPISAGQHDVLAVNRELGERRISLTVGAGVPVSVNLDLRR